MANLLLTEVCVRSCPYCFAKTEMAGSPARDVLSWENLVYVADFFDISRERHLSLLGGEPTLHSDFTDIVLYLLRREFQVTVFTSGIVEEGPLGIMAEHLGGFQPQQLSFVCNINEPRHTPKAQTEKLHRFLSLLGHLTTPGFNIFEPDFQIDFLFELICRFGLLRSIRLGLAHPIPMKANAHLGIKDLPAMAGRLAGFFPRFQQYRVSPGLDCGFPLCVFSDEQLASLFKMNKNAVNFGCGPAIDIGIDLSVWPCFPLSEFHRKSLYDFNSLGEIGAYYREIHEKVRMESPGLFDQCDECIHRENQLCQGGCISHAVAAFRKEPRMRIQDVYA